MSVEENVAVVVMQKFRSHRREASISLFNYSWVHRVGELIELVAINGNYEVVAQGEVGRHTGSV